VAKKQRRTRLKHEAAELAHKVHIATDRAFSVPQRELVFSDLLIGPIDLSYRPHVGGTMVTTSQGEKGFWVDDTLEQILFDWARGKFAQGDKVYADEWRRSLSTVNLEAVQKALAAGFGAHARFQNLPALVEWFDERCWAPSVQQASIDLLLRFNQADPHTSALILRRWRDVRGNRLPLSAPYAWYCARVLWIFYFALGARLLGTRNTNRVDLEYLLYLPFCYAFCSGDAFHDRIAPVFLDAQQNYIRRDELKADLAALSHQVKAELAAGRTPGIFPPERQGSITLSLWKKHGPAREKVKQKVALTPEQQKELVNKTLELGKTAPPGPEDRLPFTVQIPLR
jgi:hypothetical protein